MRISRALIAIISINVIIAGNLWGMSMFDAFKVYLFSEVNGVVTLEGQPVVGAEVIRSATLSKTFTDRTITDTKGYFHFDEMTTQSFSTIMPGQRVIMQKIVIKYKNEIYLGWDRSRREYDQYGELNNMFDFKEGDVIVPLDFTCELKDEPTITPINGLEYSAIGICKWPGSDSSKSRPVDWDWKIDLKNHY